MSGPQRSAGVLDATYSDCAETAAEESHKVSTGSLGVNGGFIYFALDSHPVIKGSGSYGFIVILKIACFIYS